MEIEVMVAQECHTAYAEAICEEIYISSLERKTGIANRTPDYINERFVRARLLLRSPTKASLPASPI